MYRDGANYKNYSEVVFSNPDKLTIEIIEKRIRSRLIDEIWFVAKSWNLPDIHFKEYAWDSEIDHDWHEFISIEETLEKETKTITISIFLSIIEKLNRIPEP
jgi:hypothetical protein